MGKIYGTVGTARLSRYQAGFWMTTSKKISVRKYWQDSGATIADDSPIHQLKM